ncbi:MAG: T9SS type A sorting domain-containing protein [Chlorobi bacterium]|nr:T9SS type A sorting domain-containing protein [Chlorobiota bacterium]
MSGLHFQVKGTVGQAVIGMGLNSFHRNNVGFWYTSGTITSVVEKEHGDAPERFFLFQNYPNPFGSSVTGAPLTVLGYILPERVRVTMVVYDAYGRKVAVRSQGVQEKGYQEVEFDGAGLPAGVYLITLQAGKNVRSIKALLVR